jgi:hypothetical protein
MKKLFLLCICAILLNLCFVSALDTLGTYKKGDDILIIQLCAKCNYNNVTSINYPNSTEIVTDIIMAQDGSRFTYTLPGNLTGEIGKYNVNGIGDLEGDGEPVIWVVPFTVTPSGFANTLGFFILILCLSAGVIVFGFSISDPIITILGTFGLYFLALYIFFNGIAGVIDPLINIAFGTIILGIAFYISTKSAYELIVD